MAERANLQIMPELKRAQERHGGYLPAEELRRISRKLDIPLYQLYGVATFFPHFRLQRPPDLDVLVCGDLSCRLRDADGLFARCREAAARRSPDQIAVSWTSCLGRCDGAPAMSVNNQPFHGLDDAAKNALYEALAGRRQLPPASASAPLGRVRLDPYRPTSRNWAALDGVLKAIVGKDEKARLDVIAKLDEAKLVGLGGAGFPAAVKWTSACTARSTPKFVICNADESEPGTIKDRAILTTAPHLVVEGMAIAAVLIGAEHGWVYIRHEYEAERASLEDAIAKAKQDGVLGPRVRESPYAFDLRVFVSPGGYICGEESALMETLEGKRAQPRLRGGPPPAIQGLLGQPTLINNVETFTHVPAIMLNGSKWYREQGIEPAVGLKFMGISGDVKKPGVYELPLGTTLAQVIDVAGGMRDAKEPLKAFLPSGASSGVLPARDADTPLEWSALRKKGTMLGSSAIVVLDESRCMVRVALNIARFFERESCGKCWPCRVGSEKLADMLDAVTRGRGANGSTEPIGKGFLDPIDDLAPTLALTSICALGMSVPAPIKSVQHYFAEEVRLHVEERRCPANVCWKNNT